MSINSVGGDCAPSWHVKHEARASQPGTGSGTGNAGFLASLQDNATTGATPGPAATISKALDNLNSLLTGMQGHDDGAATPPTAHHPHHHHSTPPDASAGTAEAGSLTDPAPTPATTPTTSDPVSAMAKVLQAYAAQATGLSALGATAKLVTSLAA